MSTSAGEMDLFDRLVDGDLSTAGLDPAYAPVAVFIADLRDALPPADLGPDLHLQLCAAARVTRSASRPRRRLVQAAIVVGVIGLSTSAAATGALPYPVQSVVHDIAHVIGLEIPDGFRATPSGPGRGVDAEGGPAGLDAAPAEASPQPGAPAEASPQPGAPGGETPAAAAPGGANANTGARDGAGLPAGDPVSPPPDPVETVLGPVAGPPTDGPGVGVDVHAPDLNVSRPGPGPAAGDVDPGVEWNVTPPDVTVTEGGDGEPGAGAAVTPPAVGVTVTGQGVHGDGSGVVAVTPPEIVVRMPDPAGT